MEAQNTQKSNKKSAGVGKQHWFFIFYDGRESYGLSPESVKEVVSVTHTTPVPFTPPWIDGVVSIRGEILPVIDLVKYFGIDSDSERKRSRLIFLSEGNYSFAVWSDQIVGVETIFENQLEHPMSSLPDNLLQCISHQFRFNERLVYSVDLKKLISASHKQTRASQGLIG